MATLQQTLDSLTVPAAFARHDRIMDPTVLAELHAWRSNTQSLLKQLDSFDVSDLSISALAGLVRVLAPLTAPAQWSSPATRLLVTVHLARITASDQLIAHILAQVVKPLFASTLHPRLHTSTARILPRPADIQDTYVEQPWKEHPGLDEVIRWCLLNTESSAYENTWPLFLPPIMTLLDDYQVPYKLLGVRLVSDMLTRVPPQLLLRTGVDTLIFNSLINSLAHLGDRSTPDLIRLVVTATLQLIDITTPSVSSSRSILLCDNKSQDTPKHSQLSLQSQSLSTRFSRLSTLLSSSLLGTIIMYTPTFLPPEPASASEPDPFTNPGYVDFNPTHVPETPLQGPKPHEQFFNPTLIAAAQSLPPVLSALGIGGARFMKGVIPILAEWLTLPFPIIANEVGSHPCTNEEASSYDAQRTCCVSQLPMADVTLHLASLSSLSILLCTCTPQIGGWSATIVDAIGRCWIGCLDIENQERGDILSKDSLSSLKKQLKEIAIQLSEVYPDVAKNEYAILLAFNRILFDGLVG